MRLLLVVLLIGVASGGCAGSQTTHVESATGTVDALIKTCAADRPDASLEMLTAPAKDALVEAPTALAGCLELLGLHFPGVPRAEVADELSATRVVSVKANDLSAAADLSTRGGERSRVELEKSRGVWSVRHAAAPSRP
jgi:hypothetical protein